MSRETGETRCWGERIDPNATLAEIIALAQSMSVTGGRVYAPRLAELILSRDEERQRRHTDTGEVHP